MSEAADRGMRKPFQALLCPIRHAIPVGRRRTRVIERRLLLGNGRRAGQVSLGVALTLLERNTMALMRRALTTAAALGAVALAGCAHHDNGVAYQSGGFHPFGGGHPHASGAAPTIGVNAFLWRATLDTLAFMPLSSADPYGGVVITEWYANPEKPDERFKCTVYILDTRLRADGLNVTVYKQVRDATGGWIDAAASDQTAIDIENAILTRARQLRLSNVSG
jgi:hypothetical protein